MSTSTIYCQTCSSQLTPPALKLAFIPPCCRIPICAPCIAHNPRLSEYSPCLRCGDLTTREGESKVIRGRRAQEWKEADREGGQLMFDAEGDEVDDLEMGPGEGGDSIDKTEKTSDPAADTKVGGAALNAEEVETVEVKHPVTRGDTLIAIARRYATDPHELLELNNLPPTALSSNPRILQTRKSIIISRRRIPKSQLSALEPMPATPLDPEEAKRRQEERAVKRFQLVTKTVDPGVGKAYLSIQGEGSGPGLEEPHPLELGSGETIDEKTGQGKKKVHGDGHLTQEDRAVEQWFEDDEWEQKRINGLAKKKDGKWTTVGGGSGWSSSTSKMAEGGKA